MGSKRHRIDFLALLGGLAALLDSAWGAIAVLGLDPSRTIELILGITFLLGLPIYLLDLWINKRIAIFVLALFLFRWITGCFAGGTPHLCSPISVPASIFLFSAFVLLQSSKLRLWRKAKLM